MSNDDIRWLVEACLAGEQDAATRLVERYRNQVFGLCYRMLGHYDDAEDVAQETFVRALKSLHRWDHSRDFLPWLFAIAGNRCRTHLAKHSRRGRPEPLPDQVPEADSGLQAAQTLAEEMRLALADLRDEYRQAFLLFHEHEMGYAEIAQIMDCPLGTAKTWVRRARGELVRRLSRRGVIQEPNHVMRKV